MDLFENNAKKKAHTSHPYQRDYAHLMETPEEFAKEQEPMLSA